MKSATETSEVRQGSTASRAAAARTQAKPRVSRMLKEPSGSQTGMSQQPEAERHQPISGEIAHQFGEKLGADLSGVRLHSGDGVVKEYGAAAVTTGRDIHFTRNADMSNRALLGHELVHTVQQGAVPRHDGSSLVPGTRTEAESEANRFGPFVAQGGRAFVQQSVAEARPVAVRSTEPAPLADPMAPVEALQQEAAIRPISRTSVTAEKPVAPRPMLPAEGKLEPAAGRVIPKRPAEALHRTAALPWLAVSAKAEPPAKGKAATASKTGIGPAVKGISAIAGRRPPLVTAHTPSAAPAPPPDFKAQGPSAEWALSLIAEAAKVAAAIRQSASSAATAVRKAAQDHGTDFSAEHSVHASALKQHASRGREELTGHQQGAVTAISAHAQAAQIEVSSAGQTASGRVRAGSERERQRAGQKGEEVASTFAGTAVNEAIRFQQGSAARSAQVQAPSVGGDDSAEAQAEASEKIGNQAAQNFTKDEAEVERANQQAVEVFGSHIQHGIANFSDAAERGTAQISSGIAELVETATSGFSKTAVQAAGTASTFASQAGELISQGSETALNYLTRGVEATAESFHNVGEYYASQMEQHGSELAASVMGQAYAAAASIVQAPAEQGQKLLTEARSQLQDIHEKAGAGLATLSAGVTAGLGKHAAATAEEMANATAEAATHIAHTSQQAGEKLFQVKTHVAQQLKLGGATVAQQAHQISTDMAAELAQEGSEFDNGLQRGTQQAQQAVANTVDKAAADQQNNLGVFQKRKSSAASEIASQYDSLKAQADSQSKAEQQQKATQAQSFLEWILPASWTKAIKEWFAAACGKWIGGFLYGLISAAISVLIIVGIAALLALLGGLPALIFIIAVLLIGIVVGIYSRFKMFEAYNGRGPGVGEGILLFLLGILDITGVPQIVEGIAGKRAFSNGHKMDDFDAGEAVGSGIVQLIAIIFGIAKLRGVLRPKIKPVDVKPPEVKVDPTKPVDPTKTVDPTKDPGKTVATPASRMIVVRNGNSVTVTDATTKELVGLGDLGKDAYLELAIYTKEANTSLRGGEVFDAIVDKFRADGIAFNGISLLYA